MPQLMKREGGEWRRLVMPIEGSAPAGIARCRYRAV